MPGASRADAPYAAFAPTHRQSLVRRLGIVDAQGHARVAAHFLTEGSEFLQPERVAVALVPGGIHVRRQAASAAEWELT